MLIAAESKGEFLVPVPVFIGDFRIGVLRASSDDGFYGGAVLKLEGGAAELAGGCDHEGSVNLRRVELGNERVVSVWVTSGRVHTCALPDPSTCMTDDFLMSLVLIAEREGESAAEFVSDVHERLVDNLASKPTLLGTVTPGLEEKFLPNNFLHGHIGSSASVVASLESISLDWRLESFEAVEEVLDDLTGAGASTAEYKFLVRRPRWRYADRLLWLAIVGCLAGGPALAAFSVWYWLFTGPHVYHRGHPIEGIIVGLVLFGIGMGELVHRVRHGPQKPGRRIRR